MSQTLPVLVVDVGNTSIKWAVFVDKEIVWHGRDEDLDEQDFDIRRIYFASVRSEQASNIVLESIKKRYIAAVCIQLHVRLSACNVTNAYNEPHRLGIDRWLGVLYAYNYYRQDVVVIDAGTAVKIDVVEKRGVHLGGFITPSAHMMEQSLVSNTGKIRFSEADMEGAVGLPNNTGQAVRFGCREMVIGFVERILRRYPDAMYLFTGGDGESLMKQLNVSGFFDPDIVLKGAKLLGDERVAMQ